MGLTPDLAGAQPLEALAMARDSVCCAFGVLPWLFAANGQGPMTREAQRHLIVYCLQSIGESIAEEASAKLGARVGVDLMTLTTSFDARGHTRAIATLVSALAMAKTAGLTAEETATAFKALDWSEAGP